MNSHQFAFIIECNSENTLLLSWPEVICATQHQQIIALQHQIKQQFSNLIIETIVSYNSQIIYYDFLSLPTKKLIHFLEKHSKPHNKPLEKTIETIEIPVLYNQESGWDLANIAKQTSLSIEEIIQQHSNRTYRAFALGFTPGFCYLGQLPQQLMLPRKATPRLKVPCGAVAIAGEQTAIYPNQSPGGWHIIGQTPLPMYQCNNGEFTPTISDGQSVKFYSISKAGFLAQQQDAAL